MNRGGALEGLRVVDFSRVLAGPFCTMLLGDLGADVIKIENPAGGDETRQWGPPWAGDGLSAYFLSVNRNKRSIALDLKDPADLDTARALASRADVMVENFKPGWASKFGLGYSQLEPDNPGLVYCAISGFGQEGPYSQRPGYDFVIQAMSGLMSITGPEEGPPSKVGVAISDVAAGLFAAFSILAALQSRRRTGQGQRLDVSLLNSQIAALVNVASNYLVAGRAPARHGNHHANIVPYQTFAASDGQFVVAVGNDGQFSRLCQRLGHPEWARDRRFATNPERVRHRAELTDLLASVFRGAGVAQWVKELLAIGVPAGPINDIPAILEDPHVQAQELVRTVRLEGGETVRMVGPAVAFSKTPAEIRLPPPRMDQHRHEILSELEADGNWRRAAKVGNGRPGVTKD